ncbi:MAG: hypothetical protein CO094_01390 [Anaerolineae bacterium CG_4_9_14_3_um_filter_57_17]|nr:MAG: hypothetical protein CO094_01390 [Anaerolineae bacterium CG_4_9_14_3_um_filter_57_17]
MITADSPGGVCSAGSAPEQAARTRVSIRLRAGRKFRFFIKVGMNVMRRAGWVYCTIVAFILA